MPRSLSVGVNSGPRASKNSTNISAVFGMGYFTLELLWFIILLSIIFNNYKIMSSFEKLQFEPRHTSNDSKLMGQVEVNGVAKQLFIPNEGIPELYVEGISEPIIKVDIDFIPGEGWKIDDVVENPELQSVIASIPEIDYKAYLEEVGSYRDYLNQTKPDGIN